MTWQPWTPREVRRLVELRLSGLSVAECAAALGRTRDACRDQLFRSGVRRTYPGRAKWLGVLARPHTLKGVAAAMGVGVGAVKQRKRKLRRAGVRVWDCPRPLAAGQTARCPETGRFVRRT